MDFVMGRAKDLQKNPSQALQIIEKKVVVNFGKLYLRAQMELDGLLGH